jgi:8-oxo-dGTP pyrophosphatase MutT (NUDIX family)
MENPYEEDKERVIERNEKTEKCLEEFRAKLEELHPDVNVDLILQKPLINTDTIISYGIIEFVKVLRKTDEKNQDKKEGDFIYYHAFRKRNTVEFDTIIRGFASKHQLFDMLCLLSQDERDRILKYSFDTIWNDYWVDHDDRGYSKIYKKAKEKFPETLELLKIVNKYIPCKLNVRPLIFPKGRKGDKETSLQAALREAQEEIKVPFTPRGNKKEKQQNIEKQQEGKDGEKENNVYFNDPIIRHYIGSDGKKYTDYYYLWKRKSLYKCPIQKLLPDGSHRKPIERLRTETIGHELESDIWIEIPIFTSKTKQWEWENSIDPYARYGMFHRHFKILLEIHSRLTE